MTAETGNQFFWLEDRQLAFVRPIPGFCHFWLQVLEYFFIK